MLERDVAALSGPTGGGAMASQRAERSLLWPGVLVGVGVAATVLLAGLLLLRGGGPLDGAAASRQDRNYGRR
jgi:hypothetical protein